MSSTQRTFIALLVVAAAALVGWRVVAWRTAADEHAQAAAVRASVAVKGARIAELRAQPAVNGFGAKPADDVMPLANRVLDAAHVPAARLRAVQPEGDHAVTDDRDGRHASTVRLSLEPLTVPELGAFLAAWRSSQQVWSVSRIDLNAIPPSQGARAGSYRASVTVTATYLDDLPGTPPSTPPPTPPSAATSPLLGHPQ